MSLPEPHPSFCSYPKVRRCQECGRKTRKDITHCPRCGGELSPVEFCANPAGKGTDHKGEGPCYIHGGRTFKDGKYSEYFQELFLRTHKAETQEILKMIEKDSDSLLEKIAAKAALLFFQTGSPAQAHIVLKTLQELVRTEKERIEKGVKKKEEPGDLAQEIIKIYFEKKEQEFKKGKT